MSQKTKNLDDVFEKPVGKILVKRDPEFEKEVNDYLDTIKNSVRDEETNNSKKTRRKHNVSEEGRKAMLANLQKGREQRKVNINKEQERRQDELKKEQEVKSTINERTAPKVEAPKPDAKAPQEVLTEGLRQTKEEKIVTSVEPKAKPVFNVLPPKIIEPPKPKVFSMLKKPLW